MISFDLATNRDYYQIIYIDGLVQERRHSIANALELRLSCTNPLIWTRDRRHSSGTFMDNQGFNDWKYLEA